MNTDKSLQIIVRSIGKAIKRNKLSEFAINLGFAVENVWITMLMIVFETPAQIDSFVWITPVILAILLRPYLIRLAHKSALRAATEINFVSVFLLIGSIGAFLVGQSCSKFWGLYGINRIAVCSVGWTLMDFGFQLSSYFSDRCVESYNQYGAQVQSQDSLNACNGMVVGYIISIGLGIYYQNNETQSLFVACMWAYRTVAIICGFVSLFNYFTCKITSSIIQNQIRQSTLIPLTAKASYFLPGFMEYFSARLSTKALLGLYFINLLVGDIVAIYLAMWFTAPTDLTFKYQGISYQYGVICCGVLLLGLTLFTQLSLALSVKKYIFYLFSNIALILSFAYSFQTYNRYSFILVVLSLGLYNIFFNAISSKIQQQNQVYSRCLQVVDRFQKLFVLVVMPATIMLGLNRDDVPDCLLWGGIAMCFNLLLSLLYTKQIVSGISNKQKIQ